MQRTFANVNVQCEQTQRARSWRRVTGINTCSVYLFGNHSSDKLHHEIRAWQKLTSFWSNYRRNVLQELLLQ